MGPRLDYSKDLFKQLEDVYEKLDKIEKKHRKQINDLEETCRAVKQELAQTKEALKVTETKLHRTEKKLAEKDNELRQVKQDLSAANKKIESLESENTLLRDDNERMKRILNNDSDNSSLPPSSGGTSKPANTYNGRKKTRQKQGAQKGHKGNNLSKKDIEKKIADGKITCNEVKIGNPSNKFVTRYRLDMKVTLEATKYTIYADSNGKFNVPKDLTADVTYGSTIGAICAYLYSEGVVAVDRIADFINSISGNLLNISAGTVYKQCHKFAALCENEKGEIIDNLLNGKIICTDATNIRKNGKQTYIRNFSDNLNMLFVYSPKKKLEVLEDMIIFQKFSGIFIHDHETSIYHFGTGHGECNVHLDRYLRKNTEETHNTWSRKLSCFLAGINEARKKKILIGAERFTEDELTRYDARFSEILTLADEQHKHTKGKIAYAEEKKLINRIKKYKENHLLFMYNFAVPYDNNMSERDLRKCKNRQKMAGGFRTDEGIEMYCNIMSVVETIKRRNLNILDSISTMLAGGSVFA